MAISSTSTHFKPISMSFRYLVDGVLGNLDDQILVSHHGLAGQARGGLQPPGLVQHVVFQLVGLLQRLEALADHHVAGGAGTGLLAGMFDVDAVAQGRVQHGLAGTGPDHRALGAVLRVGQENDLGHAGHSSISVRLRPARAAFTEASMRRAAKASVIWVRRLVCCSMACRSLLSSRACKAAISASMTWRSSASSRRSPSACRAAC